MNDDQLDDLKDFVSTTVLQTEARLTERIDGLEQKMDDGFAGVGEAIAGINERIDDNYTKLDNRIITLEQKPA